MPIENNTQHFSNKIKLLPEHIIDQIKAGEVIERPASLLKELMENSLDAGASKIEIHLKDNGLTLIGIEDDGAGIELGDLPYAFCRHATSKIEKFEDLYSLSSFGFRGEALASIASISRLTCFSSPGEYTATGASGGKIVIHGGEQKSVVPYTNNKNGTSIFINDLFYNTPARLKFIKSQKAEKNALQRVLDSFILTNPQVTFIIKWDEREKEIYPAVDIKGKDGIKRIIQALTKKNDHADLLSVAASHDNYHLNGFFSKSSTVSNVGKKHFLFVNNRPFTDRQLHCVIVKTLEPIWHNQGSGHYLIKLTVPTNEIDVNVHPNKAFVKFFKAGLVYSLVVASLKKTLESEKKNSIANSSVPDLAQKPTSTLTPTPFSGSSPLKEDGRHNINLLSFYYPISSRYGLIGFDYHRHGPPYILATSKIFTHYWCQKSKRNFPVADHQMIPLLICEPYNIVSVNVDNYLPFLKLIGLELDRLDKHTLVLRSKPDYFSDLEITRPLSNLLRDLNNFKEALSIDSFCSFLDNNFELEQVLAQNQVEAILAELEKDNDLINYLSKKNYIRLLDDKTAERLLF